MKLYSSLLLQLAFAGVIVLPTTSAGGGDCCKFTLSSEGSFSCPAGQLSDGQIRLNGSEPESTFCLDSKGGITDDNGYGCIVTAPPTTQVQCNANTSPDDSFSIDSSGNLEYKGSSSFFACPATDIEYNIYVAPNFGQKKCFPITLQASGCQAQTSSTCAASTVTAMITQWQTTTLTGNSSTVTETTTQTTTQSDNKSWTKTVVSTILSTIWQTTTCTETLPCTTSSSSSSSTSSYSISIPHCRLCNMTTSTSSSTSSCDNMTSTSTTSSTTSCDTSTKSSWCSMISSTVSW